MSQAPSLTTFVVGERLPWPDGSAVGEDARAFDPAIVYQAGFAKKCSLRRISALGATPSWTSKRRAGSSCRAPFRNPRGRNLSSRSFIGASFAVCSPIRK